MIFDIWINENQDTLRKPRAPSVYIYIYTQKSHLRTRKPHDGLQPADKWPLMQVKSAAKSLAEATFYLVYIYAYIYTYIYTHM